QGERTVAGGFAGLFRLQIFEVRADGKEDFFRIDGRSRGFSRRTLKSETSGIDQDRRGSVVADLHPEGGRFYVTFAVLDAGPGEIFPGSRKLQVAAKIGVRLRAPEENRIRIRVMVSDGGFGLEREAAGQDGRQGEEEKALSNWNSQEGSRFHH